MQTPQKPFSRHTKNPQSRGVPNFDFLAEDSKRKCIKIYNEEDKIDLPSKRLCTEQAKHMEVKTALPNFCLMLGAAVNEMNNYFSSCLESSKPAREVLSLRPVIEEEKKVESYEARMERFVKELDKATKFTQAQLRVLETFGIPYQADPRKCEPRIIDKQLNEEKRIVQEKPQGLQQNLKKIRSQSMPKLGTRFTEFNADEAIKEIPVLLRPKIFNKSLVLKPISDGFSLRKMIIKEHRDKENIVY